MSKLIDDAIYFEEKWQQEYEQYNGQAAALNSEIQTVISKIHEDINQINTLKFGLRNELHKINAFLNRYGNIGKAPAFRDLVPEFMAQNQLQPLVSSVRPTIYSKREHPATLTQQVKYRSGAAWNAFVNHSEKNIYSSHAIKDFLAQQIPVRESERISYANDLLARQNSLQRYRLIAEIVRLYRTVFSDLCDAVFNIILPELPVIRAFLHAQGVWEAISNDRLPSQSSPVGIKRFEHSSAYGRHYTFVKNTVGMYSLLLKFYQSNRLSEMISDIPEVRQNASAVDQMSKPVFSPEMSQSYNQQLQEQDTSCARHKQVIAEDNAKVTLFTKNLSANALPKGVR